jgi:hypothetical protein
MSSLQQLGRRLDRILSTIRQDTPKLETRFLNYIAPQFLNLIDSNTSLDLESRMIRGINSWADLLEMELKGLFEKIN